MMSAHFEFFYANNYSISYNKRNIMTIERHLCSIIKNWLVRYNIGWKYCEFYGFIYILVVFLDRDAVRYFFSSD